jgi:hypothetical protein
MKTEKICKRCNRHLELNLNNFYKKGEYFSNRCKPCTKIENKQNYNKHKNKYLDQKKQYWLENKQKITQYRNDNKEAINKSRRIYMNQKRKNPLEKIKKNAAECIRRTIKTGGFKKTNKTHQIIGCNYKKLMVHLISTFENNYKIKWEDKYLSIVEIDHILPINLCIKKEDVYELNHYTNLQFLYSEDNNKKKDRLNWTLDLSKTNLYNKIKEIQ